MLAVKQTTEHPELAERFNRVLGETVEALEEANIQYAFLGGVASGALGRPRSTHDIDVFVKPEAAELTLRALAKKGFRTEKTDPSWLYKGWKEDILVDVIFKSKGEIYLDKEMYDRTITAEFHEKHLKLVAPEDLIIIKASAHSELCPGHWHDALALLTHASIDWSYLIQRARRAPRRILSLMIYAHSNDIYVPKFVIDDLFRNLYGEVTAAAPPQRSNVPRHGSPADSARAGTRPGGPLPAKRDNYAVAHLRDRIARDPRTNELDIQIRQQEDSLLIRGEVQTPERKNAVDQIARETVPGMRVENQLRVVDYAEPPEEEEVR